MSDWKEKLQKAQDMLAMGLISDQEFADIKSQMKSNPTIRDTGHQC